MCRMLNKYSGLRGLQLTYREQIASVSPNWSTCPFIAAIRVWLSEPAGRSSMASSP